MGSSTFFIIMGVLLVLLIIVAAIKIVYDSSSKGIKSNLKKLGKVKGKSYDEIAYVLGNPTSTVRVSSNKIVKRWTVRGYELALTFNHKNICTEMTETK